MATSSAHGSQVSPISTRPLPQPAQSLSLAGPQVVGQKPSPATQGRGVDTQLNWHMAGSPTPMRMTSRSLAQAAPDRCTRRRGRRSRPAPAARCRSRRSRCPSSARSPSGRRRPPGHTPRSLRAGEGASLGAARARADEVLGALAGHGALLAVGHRVAGLARLQPPVAAAGAVHVHRRPAADRALAVGGATGARRLRHSKRQVAGSPSRTRTMLASLTHASDWARHAITGSQVSVPSSRPLPQPSQSTSSTGEHPAGQKRVDRATHPAGLRAAEAAGRRVARRRPDDVVVAHASARLLLAHRHRVAGLAGLHPAVAAALAVPVLHRPAAHRAGAVGRAAHPRRRRAGESAAGRIAAARAHEVLVTHARRLLVQATRRRVAGLARSPPARCRSRRSPRPGWGRSRRGRSRRPPRSPRRRLAAEAAGPGVTRPVRTVLASLTQASAPPGRLATGSQVSPVSSRPLPQPAQSASIGGAQPGGQAPSAGPHTRGRLRAEEGAGGAVPRRRAHHRSSLTHAAAPARSWPPGRRSRPPPPRRCRSPRSPGPGSGHSRAGRRRRPARRSAGSPCT